MVHGNLYLDHGTYNVSVTGPSGLLSEHPQQFNGSSRFEAKDTLLYFRTNLDASQSYSVTIENTGATGSTIFDLIYVTTMGVS